MTKKPRRTAPIDPALLDFDPVVRKVKRPDGWGAKIRSHKNTIDGFARVWRSHSNGTPPQNISGG
jgi:predicted HAD superfamily Cof-like phosphohydrolase